MIQNLFNADRTRGGRLTNIERQEAVSRIYEAISERGETRLHKLAEAAGVSPRRVRPLVGLAQARLREEAGETIDSVRAKLATRFDVTYRKALEEFERLRHSDPRNASQYLSVAVSAAEKHGKTLGVADAPPTVGNYFRLSIESNQISPAIRARLLQMSPALANRLTVMEGQAAKALPAEASEATDSAHQKA
jgi:hypothetical protein